MAIEFRAPTRPITVDDFRQMCEHGILTPDERVELIEGELFAVPSMNAPHAGTDVKGKTIEICREPHDIGYASRTTVTKGDTAAFAAFPDVVFAVDELLG